MPPWQRQRRTDIRRSEKEEGIDVIRASADPNKTDPQEVPPASPGQPSEPSREVPPDTPPAEIPPRRIDNPVEPERPQELPGNTPQEMPSGPDVPTTPYPLRDGG